MQALNDWIKEIKNDPNISTLNEAQAKRSVIERILEFLGWDMYNYNEVKLEYGVETRKVDYALQINGNNEVFIEAKKPGEDLENHQKQLLDYSFGEGVELAILTNGIVWWFYLPLKKGAWDDRKFYTIDILEQEIKDIIEKFDLLLSRENVASGKAIQNAESILEHLQREKILKELLPEVWNRAIKTEESLLVDLLAETATEMGNFQPTNDEILGFIRTHRDKWFVDPSQTQTTYELKRKVSQPDTKTPRQTESQLEKPKQMGAGRVKHEMTLNDVKYDLRFVYEILVTVANWLIDRGALKESDCPIKLTTRGGKRVRDVINRTPVHTSGKDFTRPRKLKNGLYIETNISSKLAIDSAKRLLKKYGYDPEILKVE